METVTIRPMPPARVGTKPPVPPTYTTKPGDTLTSIAISAGAGSALGLYIANKTVIGDIFGSGEREIPCGTRLIMPKQWVDMNRVSTLY